MSNFEATYCRLAQEAIFYIGLQRQEITVQHYISMEKTLIELEACIEMGVASNQLQALLVALQGLRMQMEILLLAFGDIINNNNM